MKHRESGELAAKTPIGLGKRWLVLLAAGAATRAQWRATQTPECADMADRMAGYGQTGGATAPQAQMNSIPGRYEQHCEQQRVARMPEAIAAENKRQEDAAQKRLLADSAGAEKRRVLSERRPILTAMSAAGQGVLAALEAERVRDCR